MTKKSRPSDARGSSRSVSKKDYRADLRVLQIELVKLQRHFIRCGDKILVLIEGRDAAGKDGVIKRIVQHLSPRETRVVALGRPSDRDRSAWYFQRFVLHLPVAQEFVLFNRSWYNRAGVERVMGFCSDTEYAEFMETVLDFEHMLTRSGVKLFKYYLDISRGEQKKRLKDRRENLLKQWKVSPIDGQALERWDAYSLARNEMLSRTHNPITPWTVLRADDKRLTRLNLIRDLLSRLDYGEKNESVLLTDPDVVFPYHEAYVHNGLIAP
ncbi:MAG: polyphosphate kinase 2 [Alphaproteobacteria bacterium]|nr:polyphosphate kinase 2 [Alphaproteobacteria bacterium]